MERIFRTKMRKIKECKICGGKNFTFLYKNYDKALNIKKFFNLVKCLRCGVIFINPQPSFKELSLHYSKKYYSLEKIKAREDSLKVKFRIFLYNLYFNPNNKNYFLKIIFYPFVNYLRGLKIAKKGRLLDIGSGSGQFLYEMRGFKMDLYGVEPGMFDKKSSERNGLNIKKGDLISARFPPNFFDVITMNHVLEHVPNPTETIKEIYRILKKRGILIVAVPNYDSFAHKLFKKNWYQLDVPRHLFNYSTKILLSKLSQKKLKIKKIRYNSRPTQFTKSLRYSFNLENNSFIFGILDVFFAPFTYIANILKQGDQVEIWCIK